MARWAIIIKETDEVSDIKNMEGTGKPDVAHPERYDVVEVGPEVKIGMFRNGGKFDFRKRELQAAAEAERKDPEGDGDKTDQKKAQAQAPAKPVKPVPDAKAGTSV